MGSGAKDDGKSPSEMLKLHLTGDKATLLLTLHARAMDYRSRHSILNDRRADEIVRSVDYDFESLKVFGNGSFMVVRAKQIDDWLKEFLKRNPNAVVLNLGCGLDTRVSRVDPSQGVSWYDLDFPEVIKVRRDFYTDRDGYKMIESPVTEPGWLDDIPKDRPTIVISDGMMEYLTESEAKALLNRLTDHLDHGVIILDVMSSFGIESAKKNLKEGMGAEHRWAVDDVSKVDAMDPKLRRKDDLALFQRKCLSQLPMKYRLVFGLMSFSSRFKNMMHLLRYEF